MKKKKNSRRGGNYGDDDDDDDDGFSRTLNPRIRRQDDDNILCEILSRLSVKSLMRFKCVCKHWQFLIQRDPYLIDLQHSRSKLARPSLLLVGFMNNYHPEGFLSKREEEFFYLPSDLLFEEDGDGDGAASAVAHTSTNSFTLHHIMLGPVNGLICFFCSVRPAVRIYNLSTRELTPWIKTTINKKEIDPDEEPTFAFGFDPATKEHKVICVCKILGKTKKQIRNIKKRSKKLISNNVVTVCEVLIVGDNSWRRIDEVPPYDVEGVSVYANGSIYWRKIKRHEWGPYVWNPPGDGEPEIILAFDFGSEKFRVIHIPNFILDQPPKCDVLFARCVDLLEVDERVALLHRMSGYTAKLWIFDDDGKKKKKKKITTSSTSITSNNWIEETITLPFCWNEKRYLIFRAVAGTDQIIVHSRSLHNFISLHSYDRKIKTFKQIEVSGISIRALSSCFLITTFVESLLPVQKQCDRHYSTQPCVDDEYT